MNLLNADLNLVVALDALLTEQNVTRAGESIGLSQPATSAALRRLRLYFHDELLVRVGRGYELTPLAQDIREEVATALQLLKHTFAGRRTFDPDIDEREFTIVTSEYGMAVAGPTLLRRVRMAAPGVQVHFRILGPDVTTPTPEMLLNADFLILPRECRPALPSLTLYRDRWVAISGRQRGRLTLDDLASAEWARIADNRAEQAIGAEILLRSSSAARTTVAVDTPLMLAYAVTGTARLALLQERLAIELGAAAGLEIMDLPVVVPVIVQTAWWHPSRASDEGHAWMIARLRETARALADLEEGRIAQPGNADAAGPWRAGSSPNTRTALPA